MSNITASAVDAHVRERALLPTHSLIVQAPAGSGKTELLTQRFLRLLVTVKKPEYILAITFTRKAASEMSNRILQALRNASELPRPEKPHQAQTWDLANAVLQADKQHHWQLLLNPSRLQIQTIDALNASLARRLPILSGTGAVFEIATDTKIIYQTAAEQLLEQLGEGNEVSAQLEVVLLHLANRVPSLINMLRDLLARRDHWLPLIKQHEGDSLRASIESTLCAAIQHHLQVLTKAIPVELHNELVELVAYAARNRLDNNPKVEQQLMLEVCSTLTNLPGTHHDDLLAWRGMVGICCTQEGFFYSSLSKTQGFPTDNKQAKERMLALLNVFRDISGLDELFFGVNSLPSARYSTSQWRVLAALLKVLPQAVAHLQLEFQQRGQIDFVELALRAQTALGTDDNPTDLALVMDMRLQHILVDEFQDTSFTQMKLLQLLTAGWTADDGRTLFCVGDPMQSIYRFRQAEVGLFLNMQSQGLSNVMMESLQLQTNFRSSRPVVDWVNRQFPHVLPAHNDSEVGAVMYSASRAHPDASTNGGVTIHAAIERNAQQEAKDVATLVKQSLLDANKRIAILVSGRPHVNAIASTLVAEGVAFNAVEIERLKDRPLIQDLLSLTRVLLHLGDRTAWLAILRAPWCGLTLHNLYELVGDDGQSTVWSLLNDVQHRQKLDDDANIRLTRFMTVMQAALNERGRFSLRDWVQRCWIALAGPAVLNNVNDIHDANAYFSRLDEIEIAGDLSDITQLEDQLNDLYATPMTHNARVEIMTIHKSKGLEFDIVIIPSMHRTSQKDTPQLLRWAQLTGLSAEGLVLSPPQARGDEGDVVYEWLKNLEQRRAGLERGRLLYVAATRAKFELHLFGSVKLEKDGEKLKTPAKGTLLNLLWHAVREDFEKCINEKKNVVDANWITRTALRRLPLNWRSPAIAAAVDESTAIHIVNELAVPIEFDWVNETSRHIGTVTHAELEYLLNLSPTQKIQWNAEARRSIILLLLAEQGVPESLRDQACERVIKAIKNILHDERGRWVVDIDSVHTETDNELALSGVIDGVVVNGVIDRTFVDTKGIRWIIDFKTSIHEGGNVEAFLQSEALRYQYQMRRYATLMRNLKPDLPIKTALYFPLLGEWRELK